MSYGIDNMSEIDKYSSHAVPLWTKIICSVFMWLPVTISYITVWYYPDITIYYNLLVSCYILISTYLAHISCCMILMKQKQTVQEVLNNSRWISEMKKIRENRNYKALTDHVGHILHIIIIPVYQEHPTVLENTIKCLSNQKAPIIIGLALEERDRNSDVKYDHIIRKYKVTLLK